jgi:hypothetical protein
MSLQTADPPTAARSAVHSMLSRLLEGPAHQVSALRSASLSSVSVSTPHRVAMLRLDRIHAAMSLRSAAEMKGWRFLVHDGDRVVAAADSSLSGKGEHRFAHISEGPFVAGTEQAIRKAESLEAVRKGRFEPVLLTVPAVHLIALWLQNLDSTADLVMPIRPAPKGLRPSRALAADAFVAVLVDLAALAPRESNAP